MFDFNTPEFQAKLISPEGENLMLRDFLVYLQREPGLFAFEMIEELQSKGWPDAYPRIWPMVNSKDILTDQLAQRWIRWMISLELGNEVAYMIKTGHGTRFSETPVNSMVGWTKLYNREGAKDDTGS